MKSVGGFDTEAEMFECIRDAYAKAMQAIDADGIIPCGEAMFLATRMGIEKIHRDTFHASLGVGRYLLTLVWYKALTGKDITNNTFDAFDEAVNAQERKIAIQVAKEAFRAL